MKKPNFSFNAEKIGCPVKYLDNLRAKQESESNFEFKLRGETVLSFIKENSEAYNRITAPLAECSSNPHCHSKCFLYGPSCSS